MATKLHQLLAVEDDRKRSATAIINETLNTFRTKGEHFEGKLRVYTKKDDDGMDYEPERKALITTVPERLRYTLKHWRPYTDVVLQKEETNASNTARAEVVLADKSFGEWSATALLAMEKNITQLIEMLRHIPTLDPSLEWEANSDLSDMYSSVHPDVAHKTSKRQQPLVLYDATKEHPAQVQMATYDVIVGEWATSRTSGKITSGDKAQILGRAEELLIGIKKARTKANECSVVPVKGDKFFNFILTGKV